MYVVDLAERNLPFFYLTLMKNRRFALPRRLREAIEEETVKVEKFLINCTISIGVCECKSRFENHTQWLKCADAALYRAKENGRNDTWHHRVE